MNHHNTSGWDVEEEQRTALEHEDKILRKAIELAEKMHPITASALQTRNHHKDTPVVNRLIDKGYLKASVLKENNPRLQVTDKGYKAAGVVKPVWVN